MRARRKKHLPERLDAVKDILYTAENTDFNFNTAVNDKEYIDTEKIFKAKQPLYIEIGCGKGRFSVEFAKSHPEINLIAVEKESNVIVSACEAAQKEALGNLYFIKTSAEYLPRFLRDNSAERIFLNFSCPYPKNKYASHRLTAPRFLEIYKNLLVAGGEIHQKTDNMKLFEFSLENLSRAGYTLKNISLDLHNSDFEGNIVTEYEEKFVNEGLPIYRLEAVVNK